MIRKAAACYCLRGCLLLVRRCCLLLLRRGYLLRVRRCCLQLLPRGYLLLFSLLLLLLPLPLLLLLLWLCDTRLGAYLLVRCDADQLAVLIGI